MFRLLHLSALHRAKQGCDSSTPEGASSTPSFPLSVSRDGEPSWYLVVRPQALLLQRVPVAPHAPNSPGGNVSARDVSRRQAYIGWSGLPSRPRVRSC